jgi:hypothetical protein
MTGVCLMLIGSALNLSVAKYLMVSINLQAMYDKEIDPRARWKETVSLGITYSYATP